MERFLNDEDSQGVLRIYSFISIAGFILLNLIAQVFAMTIRFYLFICERADFLQNFLIYPFS